MSAPISPHSIEAESAVLATALVSPSQFASIADALKVDDFFMPAHRNIFDAMLELDRRHQPIDVVLLINEMKTRKTLERLEGGETFLLTLDTPSTTNVGHHIAAVQEKARLRTLIAACGETMSAAYGDGDSSQLLEALSEKTLRIQTGRRGDLHHVREELEPLLADFEARKLRRDAGDESAGVTGVKFGITKLDRLTTGLQPGDVVVIAAGTGGGKTAGANQVALKLCMEDGTALIFNLEMTRRQLVERAFVHLSEINSALLRQGRIDADEFKRLHSVASKLHSTTLFVHDDCYTARDILATARRWRMRNPGKKGLIVVDFIQLVRGTGKENNRAREIGLFAQALKELAKQLGVAVIIVSQINRAGMKSEHRPTKYDLKESGDIENAADLILLLHNPDELGDGPIDCYVDKNRNGECKRVRMHWRGRFYQFTNPEPGAQEDLRDGD